MFIELMQIWRDGWNEIKAIWVYEWHKAKLKSLNKEAKHAIAELKRNPYFK